MLRSGTDIIPYGDTAFLIRVEVDGFSRDVCQYVQDLRRIFDKEPGWIENVAGYDSLLLSFNPLILDPTEAERRIRKTLETYKQPSKKTGRIVEIPVIYGGEYGPDLEVIEQSSGLSADEVIQRHSGRDYLVCMMGFIPGFTFLSDVDPQLQHNRRATPRALVPAGSVGIAGWQTGIYGLDSPGGWQIIGKTELKMFDKKRDPAFLLEAGDNVRFVPAGRMT